MFFRRKRVAPPKPDIPGKSLRLYGADESCLLFLPAEVSSTLRYTISRIQNGGPLPKRIALVSTISGEGVTFLSRALGALIAHDYGLTVATVELNWWSPAPSLLADTNHASMANVTEGEATFDEAYVRTNLPGFSILQAGFLPPSKRPVTARSPQLRERLSELDAHFDHLILDIPAIRATSDAIPLTMLADQSFLVVRHGVTSVEMIREGLDEIRQVPLAGVILNQAKTATPDLILKLIP